MTAVKSTQAEAIVEQQYRKSAVRMLNPAQDQRQQSWERHSDGWFLRFEQQVDQLIKRGVDASGQLEFAKAWLIAWNDLDHDAADLCVWPDVQWEDPSMFGEHVENRADFRKYCGQFWHAMPDLQFYPVDDPWFDEDPKFGGLRVCIPWSAIGTFTRPFHMWPVTKGSPKILPNGGSLELHGVDRYNMVRSDEGPGGWQIRYGKTNYDLLNAMTDLGLLPALTRPVVKPGLLALGAVSRTQLLARRVAGRIR